MSTRCCTASTGRHYVERNRHPALMLRMDLYEVASKGSREALRLGFRLGERTHRSRREPRRIKLTAPFDPAVPSVLPRAPEEFRA